MPDTRRTTSRTVKRWLSGLRRLFTRRESAQRPRKNLAMGQVLNARDTGSVPSAAQLRQFPRLLSIKERYLAGTALVIFLIAGGMLAMRALNTQRVEVAAVGGEYTEGVIGTPQLINPLYALANDVDNDFVHLIYSGLMRYDSNEGLVMDLAESYKVSEDEMVYTFTLRENATWHDGRPVLPQDVVFTILAIQNPEYRSPLQVSFGNVSVEQIDEHTVRFTLDEPFAPFLSLLTVGLLPSHLWGSINPVNAPLAELNKKPIGSGPYEFEKLVKDSRGNVRSYTLKRNNDFYREEASISELHFKFYPDVYSAVDALRNKNVEGLAYLPTEDVAHFENEGDLQIFYPSITQYTAAFMNQSNNSVLADDDVRIALAYATDKQTIVEEALNGLASPIDTFILDGMIGEHPNVKTYAFNPTAAAQTLEDAGWTFEEEAEVRSKDGVDLTFEVVVLDSAELVTTAQLLAESWSSIGAGVNIRTVAASEFQSDTLKNRSYDILLSGELYGIDPDPYAFWHSSQTTSPGLNLAGFSNRNADELIETGRTTTDRSKRAEAYRDLQDLVAEEVAAIFLYQPTYPYAMSKKIRNVQINHIVVPADRLSTITQWHIKSRKIFGTHTPEVQEESIDHIDAMPPEEPTGPTEEESLNDSEETDDTIDTNDAS